MAKTKTAKAKAEESPEQLYASALTFVEQSQPEEALEAAQKLWTLVKDGSATQALPALNLLGEISVELGDVPGARSYFQQAVTLDPEGTVPEIVGGGAEKFLWLAQLCEEGGQASVGWFEKGVVALQHEIGEIENGNVNGLDEDSVMMLRIEKKRKLANALCGVAEIYMTDLSWEEDAEARCEALITQAMAVEDETSPEVLQTLASIRLSQQRVEDAQSALSRSLNAWKDLEPEDAAVPDFASRISLSRLLMEAEMEAEAMTVLERLIMEDDQSVEAWYLGGWCQYLLSERTAEPEPLNGSRHWLKMALKLYTMLDYEDERLLEHTKELVGKLDTVLGPEDEDAEGGDEYEEWDGIDENGEDEEMADS